MSILEHFNVFCGAKPLQSFSTGTFGWSTATVEAAEENRINDQVVKYVNRKTQSNAPSPLELQKLPNGGRFDHLLQPGRSGELLAALPAIFKDDPPVNCGARAELVGLSCNIGDLYGVKVFSPAAIANLLQSASKFWDPHPKGNVLKLSVDEGTSLYLVGDTHGQLEDVLWLFFKYGKPSETNQFLFNGDIVDRGGHALEILLLLIAFKRDCPDSVHILRGNHEDMQAGIHFGFQAELESKFQIDFGLILNICNHVVFPLIPLVAVISNCIKGNRRFCVLHGGVPVDCPGQKHPVSIDGDIAAIDRLKPSVQSTSSLQDHILFNLLWADPTDTARGKLEKQGRGNRFVQRDAEAFCDTNNLAFVVRSHEVPRNLRGAVATHGGKTYTLFSASNYMGCTGNRGGVFCCEAAKGLQLREHWAPAWSELHSILAQHASGGAQKCQQVALDWERSKLGGAPGEEAGGGGGVSPRTNESPRTAPPVPPASLSNSNQQMCQFWMERICEHKDQLFKNFSALDGGNQGFIPKAAWKDVFLGQFGPLYPQELTPGLVDQLAEMWDLVDPVPYMRFLHRFQICDTLQTEEQPSLMREASHMRKSLLDVPANQLEQLLDPNGDRSVTVQEFGEFLPKCGMSVPPVQARLLYEMMSTFMKQKVLTLDDITLCISLMSRDTIPLSDWSPVAELVANEIVRSGKTYAYAFRLWDTNHDGYLSLEELESGLRQFRPTQGISHEDVASFMEYIEGLGVPNDRISIIEFTRALAPRSLAIDLNKMMTKDLLKRVWICRPALQTLLAHHDPKRTSRVSRAQFRSCLEEINSQLQQKGRPPLSETQIQAICAIATGSRAYVPYRDFVQGLHIVDRGSG